jgi:hypothetical protein
VSRAAVGVALVVAVVAVGLARPAQACAEPQLSVRLGAGGGASIAGDTTDGFFEMNLRSELLFGGDAVDVVRVGPAVDLRTRAFDTAEAAGGAALLLPVLHGWPVVATAGLGWASRPGDADGAFALGTLAFGFRPYDFESAYGFGLELYATARYGLDDTHAWEISAGIEIDLEFLLVIPAMTLWTWITHGDPDEEETAD